MEQYSYINDWGNCNSIKTEVSSINCTPSPINPQILNDNFYS